MAIQITTARQTETLAEKGRHPVVGIANLYLKIGVSPTGKVRRSWVYFWKKGGKQYEKGLGAAGKDAVTLAMAKDKARDTRALIEKGVDPIAQAKAEAMTLGKVATLMIEGTATKPGLKQTWSDRRGKTQQNWQRTFNVHALALRDKVLGEIGVDDILSTLGPLWDRKDTHEDTRQRLEKAFDFARAQGFLPRDHFNPCRFRGHLEHLLPRNDKAVVHHAAVPYQKLGQTLTTIRARPQMAARCLELLILTATRTDQARRAEWAEFDLSDDGALWVVPAARCKRRRRRARIEQYIPLSHEALTLLRRLHAEREPGEENVFPGTGVGGHIGEQAMLKLLKEIAPEATVHGFRSSWRDWAGDSLSYPSEVLESAYGHLPSSNEAELAYRRGVPREKHAKIFEAWGAFLIRRAAGNVVAIR